MEQRGLRLKERLRNSQNQLVVTYSQDCFLTLAQLQHQLPMAVDCSPISQVCSQTIQVCSRNLQLDCFPIMERVQVKKLVDCSVAHHQAVPASSISKQSVYHQSKTQGLPFLAPHNTIMMKMTQVIAPNCKQLRTLKQTLQRAATTTNTNKHAN